MTYGWALFVLVITIGALAMYMQNANGAYREQCLFPPQILCKNIQIVDFDGGDTLFLNLTNNIGTPICIKNVSFPNAKPKLTLNLNGCANSKFIKDGGPIIIKSVGKDLGVVAGTRFATDVVLNYRICPEEKTPCSDVYTLKGHIISKVMAPSK